MSWAETKIILDAIVENGIGSANGTIVMIPMDANKYGYNLKLYDIDGVTPLADVKINGVTDPNTEIRTNAQGTAKFISGSPSHSISFSEFPSDYQYADIFTARTIRGYINDMTSVVVAPDISQFAGFNVTLLDNTGAPASNQAVTCTSNSKSYTTNSAGLIANTIYANNTSLTFRWTKTFPAGTSNNLSGTTTSTYNATTSGGTIGQVKDVTGTAERSDSTVWKINLTPTVGNTILIGTKQYIIAHVDSSTVYVVLRYLEENTMFDFSGSPSYVGSDIATKCASWYIANVPELWRTNACMSVTTQGVSAPCFIPSYGQVNGDWTYFNSDGRRIFESSSGDPRYWWTSTMSSSNRVWGVWTNGSLYDNYDPSDSYGFRPALAIKRSLFS